MSTDVTPGAPPAATQPPNPGGSERATRLARNHRGPLARAASAVYRFLYNKLAGLLIILAMALLVLLGTVVPQAPAGLAEDPQAYASWLETMRPRFGGWVGPLDLLGIFTIWSSPLFLVVSALLAASIIACTTHRVPQLWQRATRPKVHVTERFFDHARQRATIPVALEARDAAERIAADLGRRRFRIVNDAAGTTRTPDGASTVSFYADKNRWAPFGTAAAHAGFVLIIVGVVVSSLFGFEKNLPVTVGERVPLGEGTDLAVLAHTFSDSYYTDGRPSDYVADLSVYDGDAEVARQEVRVNSPIRYDGVRFHQSYFGVATVISVADAAGETVYEGGVPLQWTSNDELQSIGRLDLEEEGMSILVVTAASGATNSFLAPGQLQFEVYPTGSTEPVGTEVVSQGGETTIGEHALTFHREQQYTGIAVHKDPGAIWVWVASALMVLGMFATFGLRHRRLWVRVHAADHGAVVRIASVEKQDFHFDRTFTQFAGHVQAYERTPDPRP